MPKRLFRLRWKWSDARLSFGLNFPFFPRQNAGYEGMEVWPKFSRKKSLIFSILGLGFTFFSPWRVYVG